MIKVSWVAVVNIILASVLNISISAINQIFADMLQEKYEYLGEAV